MIPVAIIVCLEANYGLEKHSPAICPPLGLGDKQTISHTDIRLSGSGNRWNHVDRTRLRRTCQLIDVAIAGARSEICVAANTYCAGIREAAFLPKVMGRRCHESGTLFDCTTIACDSAHGFLIAIVRCAGTIKHRDRGCSGLSRRLLLIQPSTSSKTSAVSHERPIWRQQDVSTVENLHCFKRVSVQLPESIRLREAPMLAQSATARTVTLRGYPIEIPSVARSRPIR